MANMDFTSAVNAYNKVASLKGGAITGIDDSKNDDSFSSLVDNIISSNVESIKKAENLSASVTKGEASIEDLAIAVANAELSLKAIVAIRDKIVTAYQDIIRMPI